MDRTESRHPVTDRNRLENSMMRTYLPDYSDIGIDRDRYRELLYHCRQYVRWKAEAASLLGVGAQQYSTMPHGSEPGDPVGKAVARRERLIDKCRTVERAAEQVDGGRWRAALIQNICMGTALYLIDPVILPTSRRNEYYKAKRQFFAILDDVLENHKDDTRGAHLP